MKLPTMFVCCLLALLPARGLAALPQQSHILVLRASTLPVDMLVEYMDAKRHGGAAYEAAFADYLRLRYVDNASDNAALGLLVKDGSGLFPGVAVVFCGVDDFEPALLDGLREWAAGLPVNAMVHFLNYVVDQAGESRPAAAVIAGLGRPDLPVFTTHDLFMATGVLGGRLVTGAGQGRMAAEVALGILGGADIKKAQISSQGANEYVFSWRELQRFGVSAGRSPPASRLQGRPLGIFEKDPRAALLLFASIVVLGSGLLLLLVAAFLRHRSRAGLAESESKYRGLFESLTFGAAKHVLIRDASGKAVDYRFVEANPMFETLLGLRREDVLGKTAVEVYGEAYHLEEYARCVDEGTRLSFELPYRDRIYRTTVYRPSPDQFVTLFDDVTELARVQGQIARSEARFRKLFDTMEQGVVYQDTEGRITSFNAQAQAILGIDGEELARRGSLDLGWNGIHEDGSPFSGEDHPAMRALRGARRETSIIGLQTAPGRKRLWLVATAVPEFRDGEDRPFGVFVTFTDISSLKEAEEKLAAQAKELTQKNEELERFAYTVSHDLKSPLVTIKGFLSFVRKDIAEKDDSRLMPDLDRIAAAADRMQELLADILELSRVGRNTDPPRRFSMRDALALALEGLAGGLAAAGATVVEPPSWPEVVADRSRLAEVWQNLLENALKYRGPESPRIVLGWEKRGNELVFRVTDNGIGLEPRFVETIFGLFNKLDPKCEGTGIGLALVRRIVECHGGTTWVESAGPGSGSTFHFSLPLPPAAPASGGPGKRS